jgi:hypothetical protein
MVNYQKIVYDRKPHIDKIVSFIDQKELYNSRFLYRITKGDSKIVTGRFLRAGTDVITPEEFVDYDMRDYIKLHTMEVLGNVLEKTLKRFEDINSYESLFIGIYKKNCLEVVGGEEYCFGDKSSNEDRLESLDTLLRLWWGRNNL